MTKICIFIPTHIYYENQINLLQACIFSTLNQTILPDIFVSVSFENIYYQNKFIENILKQFSTKIKVNFSKERKYQMEHIDILTKLFLIPTKNYDLVMFCDDDDTYANNRVEKFIEAYEYGLSNNNNSFEIRGVREYINTPILKNAIPEYWCYGIQPSLLIEFFNRIENNMNLLKHKFADEYLRNFLIKCYPNKIGFCGIMCDNETGVLYNYNKNNPDSICYKVEHKLIPAQELIRDSLLLAIIYEDMNYYNGLIHNFNLTPQDVQKLVQEKEQIKKVCKILYK